MADKRDVRSALRAYEQPSMLQGAWDEISGAFARYGRRSGAQRDASLAMLNQAVDPNTDPLTGVGMKALGLAGLVTHPLAFFPTGDEWRERTRNAGNTGRMGQAIGGVLGDLPSIVDPHLLAGGGALAAAPLIGKMAKPGLGKGLGDLMQDAASNKELDALGARLQAEAAQTQPRKFYRGTTGGTERIDEPFVEARGLTFMARKPESARMYGQNIEEITAKPDAKILDDEMPEFWRLIGRKRPPNGFVGSARGGTVAVVNDAVKKAKEAGYDAVSFSSDADIGTVLINEGAFIRGGNFGGSPSAVSREQALESVVDQPQRRQLTTQSYKETLPDGTERWVPGTLRSNPTTAPRFEPSMSVADIRRYIEQFGEPPPPRAKGEIVTGKRKDVYPDGTVTPVPGLLRTKRPDSK